MSFRSSLTYGLMRPWVKPIFWIIWALPGLLLAAGAVEDTLGPNPAEVLIDSSGEWAIRFLWITLAISPLRDILRLPVVMRYRRGLGLTAFFYACLHFLSYAWLDQSWSCTLMLHDVLKRNFILVGSAAFVLMSLLALTSFNQAIRWMNPKRWHRLHQTIYIIAILVLVHFYWKQASKNRIEDVKIYAVVLIFLLGWRLFVYGKKRGWRASFRGTSSHKII